MPHFIELFDRPDEEKSVTIDLEKVYRVNQSRDAQRSRTVVVYFLDGSHHEFDGPFAEDFWTAFRRYAQLDNLPP